jgi:hypothetical protein
MDTITLQLRPDADGEDGIPHGHGASFKRGIIAALDGVPDDKDEEQTSGNEYSYRRGKDVGKQLVAEVAKRVRK